MVIPTYNEAGNVTRILDGVLQAAPEVDVLVVDDSSPDGTADLVRAHWGFDSRVRLVSRPDRDGLGGAYRAGFRWALARDYDVIAQMDADLSHPPERLPALLAALDHADLSVGSRYVSGGAVRNWPWTRRLISGAGNAYVRLVLNLPVRDSTAGFKAFRCEALHLIGAVDSQSDGYCFQIENTWKSSRFGLRIVEVPITFTDRTVGNSKMSSAIVREAVVRVLQWRWGELCGTEPSTRSPRSVRL